MATNTYASLSDLFSAETVSGDFLMLLADRAALPNHPALYYDGPIDGTGSNTSKVPHIGLGGYDLPDQVGDGADIVYKQITDSSSTVAVVRYSRGYERTDLVAMASAGRDHTGPSQLALDAVMGLANRQTDLICDVIDGFAATGGPGTGADLTVASTLAVAGALRVNNVSGAGGFMGVIHGQQWSDLIVDGGATLAAGTQQYNQSLASLQVLRGEAFQGQWLGIDWFVSNRVKTANAAADRAGAIFGRGGVIWKDGRLSGVVEDSANQMIIGERVLFERDRSAKGGRTGYVMHGYLGASLGTESGITLISDA